MHPHLYPTSSLFLMFTISILIHVPRSLCVDNDQYVSCGQLFQCGNITNIGYPFWGGDRPEHCGHPAFQLNCTDDAPLLTIRLREHRVLAIDDRTQRLTVVREDFVNNICPRYLYNFSFDPSLFSYTSDTQNLTLFYGCPSFPSIPGQPLSLPNSFNCYVNDTASVGYYDLRPTVNLCNTSVIVQVFQSAFQSNSPSISIEAALNGGFGLQWSANNALCDGCFQSGGRCGYDSSSSSFTCYCPDQPNAFTCNNSTTPNGNGMCP